MPITDENLDRLLQLPREKLEEAMQDLMDRDPARFSEVKAAIPGFKQRKAQAREFSAARAAPNAEVPLLPGEQPIEQAIDYAGEFGDTGPSREQEAALVREQTAAARYGRPAPNVMPGRDVPRERAGVGFAEATQQGIDSHMQWADLSPTNELLYRTALSPLTGDNTYTRMPEDRRLAAVNRLEDVARDAVSVEKWSPQGVTQEPLINPATAAAAAQFAATLPANLLPAPGAGKVRAASEAALLARYGRGVPTAGVERLARYGASAAAGAFEGAAMGALAGAADPEQSALETAALGGLFGAALGPAAEAAVAGGRAVDERLAQALADRRARRAGTVVDLNDPALERYRAAQAAVASDPDLAASQRATVNQLEREARAAKLRELGMEPPGVKPEPVPAGGIPVATERAGAKPAAVVDLTPHPILDAQNPGEAIATHVGDQLRRTGAPGSDVESAQLASHLWQAFYNTQLERAGQAARDVLGKQDVMVERGGATPGDPTVPTIESLAQDAWHGTMMQEPGAKPAKPGEPAPGVGRMTAESLAKSRGYLQLRMNRQGERLMRIVLNPTANESTFIHESGHAFFLSFANIAQHPDAPELTRQDFGKLLEWMGAKDWASVTRANHEKFARAFELYTRTGRAPSTFLQRAFTRFKTWLTRIYKTVGDLEKRAGQPINLSPEVRGVFDRLLATDAEIAGAKQARQAKAPIVRGVDVRKPGWELRQLLADYGDSWHAVPYDAQELARKTAESTGAFGHLAKPDGSPEEALLRDFNESTYIAEEAPRVYIETPTLIEGAEKREAKALEGRLAGRDPRNPKNVLVHVERRRQPPIDPKTGKPETTIPAHYYQKLPPDPAKFISVPLEKVHRVVEVNERAPLTLPAPPGVPPLQPQQLAPHQAKAIDGVQRLVAYLQGRSRTGWEKAAEEALPAHLRYSEDINAFIARAQGSSTAARGDELQSVLQGLLPKDKGTTYGQLSMDLARLGESANGHGYEAAWAAFRSKHPEAAGRFEAVARDILREIERNSEELTALGHVPEGLTYLRQEGLVPAYLANLYRAHYLPKGKWAPLAKSSPQRLLDDAVRWLNEQYEAANVHVGENQLLADINDILRADDPLSALQGKLSGGPGKPLTKPAQHLLARKEIPEPVKKLLGPETSGILRLSYTLATQRTLLGRLRLWRDIAEFRTPIALANGQTVEVNPYWSPGPNDVLGITVQVPNIPRIYGRAAGGYVRPEFEHIFRMGDDGMNGVAAALSKLWAVPKTNNTLWNPRSWVTNYMVNAVFNAPLAAGPAAHNPANLARAAKLLISWMKNPTVPYEGHAHSLILEARQLGALPAGVGRTEGINKQQQRLLRELETTLGVLPPDASIHQVKKVLADAFDKMYAKPSEKAGRGYDFIDQLWKLNAYLILRRQGLADAAKKGLSAGDPAAVKQASEAAAMRVLKYFPNFEHLSPVTQKLRAFPVGANFLTSMAEEVRVAATAGVDATRGVGTAFRNVFTGSEGGDVKTTANMLYMGMLYGSMLSALALARQKNDISDEEVEAARAIEAKRRGTYRHFLVALPERDSQGRVQWWDASRWMPFLQFFNGHPDDSGITRLLSNLVMAPAQDTVAESWVRGPLERAGLVTPLGRGPQPRLDQRGPTQAINALLQAGAAPAFLTKPVEALRRSGAGEALFNAADPGSVQQRIGMAIGPTGRYAEPLTPGQAAMSQFLPVAGGTTVPGVTRDPRTGKVVERSPTFIEGKLELKGDVNELKRQLRSMARSKEFQMLLKANPAEAKARIQLYIDAIKKRGGEGQADNAALQRAIDAAAAEPEATE